MANKTLDYIEEYAKHASLNLGQALQGIRYIYSHPDIDSIAPKGSLKHFRLSLLMRSKIVINDLFFASIPPHWHHSKEEIKSLHHATMKRWFLCGYCAWRFTESGEDFKVLTGQEDKRWDPRCK